MGRKKKEKGKGKKLCCGINISLVQVNKENNVISETRKTMHSWHWHNQSKKIIHNSI